MRFVWLILFGTTLFSEAALAWCVGTSRRWEAPVTSPLTYTGSADHNPHGQQIADWGYQVTDTMAFAIDSCPRPVYYSYAVPEKEPVYGMTHTSEGVTYPVYKSNVPGIGYIIGIRDPHASRWTGIHAPETRVYPGPGTGTGEAPTTLGFTAQVKFVATGRIKPGTYSGGGERVATLRVTAQDGTQMATTVPLYVRAFTLNATSRACKVTGGAEQLVSLPPISSNSFGAGAVSQEHASFSLGLSCDAGVQVYATMTDASNPSNTGSVLRLGPTSTAKGVGVQIFWNGQSTPVRFGPDSSSKGNLNQWHVRWSQSPTNYGIPFVARYYKTADTISGGSVKAASTITFSYQ